MAESQAPLILAIDCGTQSLRTLLFDAAGVLAAKAKIEYPPYFSRRPGWAEQDPELFWEALKEGCRRLEAEAPGSLARLAGVGVTAQRDTMINLDGNGRVLRPAITWLDQRAARPYYRPTGPAKWIYRAVGMDEALARVQAQGACNWIMQNQERLWGETRMYLSVSGFLNYRLTGEFRDSVASSIGHIPMDYRRQRWAAPGHLNRRMFPIEDDKLPELLPPGSELGRISRAAETATGIPQGVPVFACGSDKGCETVGMGVVDARRISLSFGTTATVQATTKRYYEPIRFMPAYPAPLPGYYNPEVEIFRGYWMISWFKNEFGQSEIQEALRRGVLPEEILNGMLDKTPPGSLGLLMQPYWTPGLDAPFAKGIMLGFGDVHGRPHFYRSLLEGLGFALRSGIETQEKAGRFRAAEVTASGGASQSDRICQLTADIIDRPLLRGHTYETSGLGAALIVALGLGWFGSFGEAAGAMIRYESVFEPSEESRRIYDDLFRVYQKIYPTVEKLYREIQSATGYPERLS